MAKRLNTFTRTQIGGHLHCCVGIVDTRHDMLSCLVEFAVIDGCSASVNLIYLNVNICQ